MIPFIRKMGIGTLLFQEFERRYQELGVETIYLEVRESNEAAYQFYLKNGFVYSNEELIDKECKACNEYNITCFPKVVVYR